MGGILSTLIDGVSLSVDDNVLELTDHLLWLMGAKNTHDPRSVPLILGFRPFRTRTTSMHVLSYVVGVYIWLGAFWLGASIFPESPYASVFSGFVVAGLFSGLYFTWLYVYAIGTPLGNVLAPLLIAIGIPYPVCVLLAPAADGMADVRAVHFGPDAPLVYAIASIPIAFLYLWYLLGDRSEWESAVMPGRFRLWQLVVSGGPPLESTRRAIWVSGGPIIIVVLLFFTIIHALFLESMGFEPEDFAGTMMLTMLLLYLVIRLPATIEEEEAQDRL